jgi:hypothetical protein
MVQRIMEVVAEYEGSLLKMQSLPRFPYERRMLPKDGATNRDIPHVTFRSPGTCDSISQ